ncbi:MAG: PAS domain-containing protein [Gemmatimonadales bacterium]|nr:PAS domain-containing protein [Gemmatimonadales bacterium]
MVSKTDYDKLRIKLTAVDRKILESNKVIVDAIALFMGPYCEVALHSLEHPERAVTKIANRHHTNREVGSALTDHGIQLLLEYMEDKKQHTSCYTTMSATGEPMRSVFTVITNNGKPIGLLGINFNMNVPLSEFISTFSLFNNCNQPTSEDAPQGTTNSIEELVRNAVSDVVHQISTDASIPNHAKNKYIVFGLHENGIFDIKGSVVLVAKELHLSKFTVYSYIRVLKEKTSREGTSTDINTDKSR